MEFREAPAGELVDVDHSGDGGYDHVPDEGCLVISVAIGDGEDGEEEGGEYAEEKAEAEGVQGVGFEGGWEARHGCAVLCCFGVPALLMGVKNGTKEAEEDG